jgi:hypothetical protein
MPYLSVYNSLIKSSNDERGINLQEKERSDVTA